MSQADHSVGLCAQCAWCHRINTAHGSTFFLCRRAETDPAFTRYPRLPVVRCDGFVPAGVPKGAPARSK